MTSPSPKKQPNRYLAVDGREFSFANGADAAFVVGHPPDVGLAGRALEYLLLHQSDPLIANLPRLCHERHRLECALDLKHGRHCLEGWGGPSMVRARREKAKTNKKRKAKEKSKRTTRTHTHTHKTITQ